MTGPQIYLAILVAVGLFAYAIGMRFARRERASRLARDKAARVDFAVVEKGEQKSASPTVTIVSVDENDVPGAATRSRASST